MRPAPAWLNVVVAAAAVLACLRCFGQAAPDFELDAKTRSEVIERCLEHVRDRYVFPETGAAMEKAVRRRLTAGEYDVIGSAAELTAKLTTDLQEVSKDKHLRVRHSASGSPPPAQGGPAAADRQARDKDFGFHRVEQLAGNIGYIDLRMFHPAALAADNAAAAMNAVAETDALIIDLRKNSGGDPKMVALLISYLIEGEPVHVNEFVGRDGEVREQFWTSKDVPGRRYIGKDVYVLTSGFTFSAAEEFAYDLFHMKRATLVGETTGGGANPITTFPAGERFRIGVPTGRARNPITGTNWEGTGVKPHVEVSSTLALKTAQLLALKKLAEKRANDGASHGLRTAIAEVEQELEALGRGGAS